MMGLVDDARARVAARPEPKRIDYARMSRVWPRQKSALTRAVKSEDPERIAQVCKDAVAVWDEIGAWPDDWGLFQQALDDVLGPFNAVRIDDL